MLPKDEDLALLFLTPYRPEEGTLKKLKRQLLDVLKQNPFFGRLSEEEERKLHLFAGCLAGTSALG